MTVRRFLLAAVFIFGVNSGTFGAPDSPRHVFLFIGDGMGKLQVEAAEAALGKSPGERLSFQNFPVKGFQRTSSAAAKVTDSAAAVTAIACGVKTNNGMLGVTPDGKEYPSIAALAHRNGWKIGIISSVSLDHATPAGFYAHDRQRGNFSDIARSMADSPFEFFGGGGLLGQKSDDPAGDNLQRAVRNGFKIARKREDLLNLPKDARILAFNHRLSGGASLPWAITTKPDDIRLSEFTSAAVRHLSGSPFFIMVEGGKIDWSCHVNDLGTTVREIEHFDEAVRVALEFAAANPDDTLIVVTADHETGALKRINDAPGNPKSLLAQTVADDFMDRIKVLQANNAGEAEVFAEISSAFGLADLNEQERPMLSQAWKDTVGGVENISLYGKVNPIVVTAQRILAARAGFRFTSGGHSDADVPVYAAGAGAESFSGTYENTEIFAKLRELMKIP